MDEYGTKVHLIGFLIGSQVLLESEQGSKPVEKETDFFDEHIQQNFPEDFSGMSLSGTANPNPSIKPDGNVVSTSFKIALNLY